MWINCNFGCASGINPASMKLWRIKQGVLARSASRPPAPLPPLKIHKFKHKLPKLSSYETKNISPSFWRSWEKVDLKEAMRTNMSWVDSDKLRAVAIRSGFPITNRFARVCHVLKNRAVIGCVGRGRLPTESKNGSSVYENGEVICDTLQDWVVKGIAAGPLDRSELSEVFGQKFTVNPMFTRPKPNGSLRIIVDMSSPRDRDRHVPGWIWSPTLAGAVNTSIDPAKFPARMSSGRKFVKMIYRAGRGCVIFKIDWCDAYKSGVNNCALNCITWTLVDVQNSLNRPATKCLGLHGALENLPYLSIGDYPHSNTLQN